ncbi:hypothetical protein LJS80_001100 [Salmonella enterica]|nr:hypothetical protein [Salmonella enterica]EIK0387677.1 hypothetical protein [Salmonella enterica]
MAIYIKSPPLVPKLPDIDISKLAGMFGAMPSGEFVVLEDCNLAPVGLYQARQAETGRPVTTRNVPPGATPYAAVMTISSEGAGKDGRRSITSPLKDGEIVVQFYYDTTLRLYTRTGNGKAGFTPWKKQW